MWPGQTATKVKEMGGFSGHSGIEPRFLGFGFMLRLKVVIFTDSTTVYRKDSQSITFIWRILLSKPNRQPCTEVGIWNEQ